MEELTKRYNADEIEDKIYAMWEKNGYFNPDKQPNIKKVPNLSV